MTDETYIELIIGYLQDTLTDDENKRLEQLIETGEIDPSEINQMKEIWHDVGALDIPEPRERMRQQFYNMLDTEKERVNQQQNQTNLLRLSPQWMMRAAAAIILLMAGFSAGLLVGNESSTNLQVLAVQEEMEQIKNALVYNAYQQTSASERIQAVGLATSIEAADDQLLMILIHTMNNDPNVNVRMASIDALRNYDGQLGVRQAFMQALAVQDNPFVQISLINTLVELNERSAVGEMEKLLLTESTEPEVRGRLMEGILELKI